MVEKLVNVHLDHLVHTDLVNLVLHLLEGTNEFLRILVLLLPEGFECLQHQMRVD
jgi:hypothetical protein